MQLKWGIAASGKISSDFVTALKALPTSDHRVVAVASRSKISAEKFAKDHSIPNSYEGYDKLAQDRNVDIVYVGVLNPQHYEVVKLLLEGGKHVLCEKPFTMNEKQTRKLLNLSKEKNLFLMEAVWSRFFPAYIEMKKIIDSGAIGEVTQVTADFGVPISHVDRVNQRELGGGTILDIGIYILQFQQFVYRGLTPSRVVANGHINDKGVDLSAAAILTYPGNKTALVSCTSLLESSCEGRVYGTKGSIVMPMFWCPTSLIVNGQTQEFPLIKNEGTFNYGNSAGLAYQAEEVRKCLKEGRIESLQITHDETLQLSQLMDKMRQDVGVIYAADTEV